MAGFEGAIELGGAVLAPITYRQLQAKDPDIFLPIYVMTGFFGGIFILGPLLVPRGPHKGIIRCSIMLAAFFMWLLWGIWYAAQMNPLVGPRIKNTTLTWIAYSWGDVPSGARLKPPPPTTPTTTTPPVVFGTYDDK